MQNIWLWKKSFHFLYISVGSFSFHSFCFLKAFAAFIKERRSFSSFIWVKWTYKNTVCLYLFNLGCSTLKKILFQWIKCQIFLPSLPPLIYFQNIAYILLYFQYMMYNFYAFNANYHLKTLLKLPKFFNKLRVHIFLIYKICKIVKIYKICNHL